jgi:hypothetical protein
MTPESSEVARQHSPEVGAPQGAIWFVCEHVIEIGD